MMDLKLLTARRTKVIEECKVAEGDRKSGWHSGSAGAEDLDVDKNPLSKRPVALKRNTTVYFVADCVPVVLAGLKTYLDKIAAMDEDSVGGFNTNCCIAVKGFVADKPATLEMDSQTYNYVLHALGEVGVKVVSSGIGVKG
jgi:hypothetical protein